ncbi:MAG: DsrE family protein [Planctomycetota bacterium]
MNRRETIASAAALGLGGIAAAAMGSDAQPGGAGGPTELAVLWSSGDPDVAHRVCLMYTHASKQYGWFETVRLVIWGPSQRILVGDKDLKAKLAAMREDGVIAEACIACANTFGLKDELEALGLPVKGMGGPLTSFLKDPNVAVLTF